MMHISHILIIAMLMPTLGNSHEDYHIWCWGDVDYCEGFIDGSSYHTHDNEDPFDIETDWTTIVPKKPVITVKPNTSVYTTTTNENRLCLRYKNCK